LAEIAGKYGIKTKDLEDFVEGIMQRMIFDGESLSDLLAPQELAGRIERKRN